MFKKLLKHFVSSEDGFLKTFNQKHKDLSDSQRAEIAKAERIAKMRDENTEEGDGGKIWSDF